MNFKEFYIVEGDIEGKSDKEFKNEYGVINYGVVPINYRYEFIDKIQPEYKLWDVRPIWYFIGSIRVYDKFKGNGKKLIKDFIDYLPKNVGLILNANPMDDDIKFLDLYNWYIKLGFKEVNKNGSLYYLT